MANNCVSNFCVICSERKPLDNLAEVFNSLRKKYPYDEKSWFGQTWLKNLAEVLNISTTDVRGYIDPEPAVQACLIMCGKVDTLKEPFMVNQTKDGFEMRFSVVSAWDTPIWFTDYLDKLTSRYEDAGFDYGYRATDEFGSFHRCHRGDIVGEVYEIDHSEGDTFSYGEEDKFLESISSITGIHVTTEMLNKAKDGDFKGLVAKLADYNENHPDEECYVYIYTEDYN